MGKFLNQLRKGGDSARKQLPNIDRRVNQMAQKRANKPQEFHGGKIREQTKPKVGKGMYGDEDYDLEDPFEDENDFKGGGYDDFDDVNIRSSQKPASFHQFVLDNKFQHLERSIRGYKDVWDKDNKSWEVKRKSEHCFTDEEAESIVRMAEAHLSADIKLARMSLEAFGHMMDLVYDEVERYFRRIMEYRFGRFGDYERQGKMKDEALKIMVELYNSIWANYSRAVGAAENKATHDSVRGQESLQNTDDTYRSQGNSGGIRV